MTNMFYPFFHQKFLVYGIIIIFSISLILVASRRRTHRSILVKNTPILLSYYTDQANIQLVDEGYVDTFHYQAYLTNDHSVGIGEDNGSAMIYRVELPFATDAHLLGIPRLVNDAQLNPTKGNSLMEAVQLEGDYNTYFNLYAEKTMGSETQYVLDPKAMIFTIDFCKGYNWEIVGNQLYFLQAFGSKSQVSVVDTFPIVEQFIREIKPALHVASRTFENTNQVPYGEDHRQDISCPICSKIMLNKGDYFQCPDDHGVLLNGARIQALRMKTLTIPIDESKTVQHGLLTCPACKHAMSEVNFNETGILIDSCSYCPYRWLDGGEVVMLETLKVL